jgi:succinoglycan biosynthesis transport protein ExoP
MENQPIVYDPGNAPGSLKDARTNVLAPRRQYAATLYPDGYEEPGTGLLLEYLQILRRRKGTLILIVFLGLLASLLLTLPQTPIYQARGSVEIQNMNENFLNMRNVSPTADSGDPSVPGSDLNTQAKILQSDSLLERVIAKLDLGKKLFPDDGTGRIAAWRKALGLRRGPQVSSREQVLAAVSKSLKVSTEANTRLVEIRYESTDPHLAADVINTLTSEFVEQNLESRWKTTQQTGDWLTRQMEDIKIKLEKSEEELQGYADASGLLFTSEKDNVAEDKVRQLQEELSKAHADRVGAQSRYELESTASPDSLPEVLDDPTLKDYEVKLTDLRRQLADISSSLTPAHPAVKKIQAQITTLQLALEKERSDIVVRIRNEYESAQRREQLLAASYASQAGLMSDQAAKVTHYNILKHEVDTDRQLYDSLLQNVREAGMSSALRASNIRVVDSAEPPTHPYKPSLALNAALGILAGAFFGIAFVVVQERADHCIRAPGEAELYLDVPELGAIPAASAIGNRLFAYYHNGNGDGKNGHGETLKLNGKSNRHPRIELAISDTKPTILADAFRATLTSILFSGENGNRPRIIVITSANPGEGKTTIASNLALALAEIGQSALMQSVLLIDGDLRKPRLHEIFGVHNRWGLADVIQGKAPPNGCEGMVFKTAFRNLSLLPSGTSSPNASYLLHSPRAAQLLSRMREEFHTVIIDTPPMLHMADARVLGRHADGVVLVVRSAETMRDSALAVSRRLTDDGTRVLGTVLNQWDPREADQYSYGKGHRYH